MRAQDASVATDPSRQAGPGGATQRLAAEPEGAESDCKKTGAAAMLLAAGAGTKTVHAQGDGGSHEEQVRRAARGHTPEVGAQARGQVRYQQAASRGL